MKNKLVR